MSGRTPGSTLAARLEVLLQGLLARKHVMHAVVAVERGDGSFRWSGAVGEATPDGVPMQAETPFFIASIDKLYTATIVLKLSERHRLRLDEPIAAFLPRALIGGLHRIAGVDYTSALTVRHLLSHTSGLPDWLEDNPKGGRSLIEGLIREGDRSISLDELIDLVRDRLTPHFPPQPPDAKRPMVRYSDTNFMLLTAIIEAVTSQPLHHVHEDWLFRPLGLRHTYLASGSQPLDRTPPPAAVSAGRQRLDMPLLMQSLSAMYSTAGDTLRFLSALTRGEVFDDPATFALMQQRWNRFGFPLDRAALRLPPWPIEYGLGIMRFHDPVHRLLARLPTALTPISPVPAIIGHTGSTGCWLFHCPELDLLTSGTVDQVTAGAVPFRFVPRLLRLFRPTA